MDDCYVLVSRKILYSHCTYCHSERSEEFFQSDFSIDWLKGGATLGMIDLSSAYLIFLWLSNNLRSAMEFLWLGYDGLSARYAEVSAVLLYHPSLDRRIAAAYGRVPPGIRAVVVTQTGVFLPSRLSAEQLRRGLARWHNTRHAS